jgi:hypothetical protein
MMNREPQIMKEGVDFTLARRRTNGEEADLEVEDIDQEEDKAYADGEEEEDQRHRVSAAARAGTPPRTLGPERKPGRGHRHRHAPSSNERKNSSGEWKHL